MADYSKRREAWLSIPSLPYQLTSSEEYVVEFVKYFYYLGVIPFRFRFDSDTLSYKLVQHKLQKVAQWFRQMKRYLFSYIMFCDLLQIACMLIFGFSILPEVCDLRSLFKDKPSKLVYFEIANMVSMVFFMAGLFTTLWFRSAQFVHLINQFRLFAQEDRPGEVQQNKKVSNEKVMNKIKVFLATNIVDF